MQSTAYSWSIIYPKFGTPLVTPDKIIFSEADGHRILCISRNTGEDLWDIKDTDAALNPCFILENKLIFTKNADIYACELVSGQSDALYQTGYDSCGLGQNSNHTVFIRGEKDDVDYFSLVDLEQKNELWKSPNITSVLTKDNGIALCKYAEREYKDDGYTYINSKLVAISVSTGQVLWTYPLPNGGWLVDAVSVNDTFIVGESGMIHCVNQQSGSIINSYKMSDESSHPTSLVGNKNRVIVWTREGNDVFSGHVIYSLSVPSLDEIDFFEPDWYSSTTFVYDDIIIGGTLYRTEAYNLNSGEKVWSGGQWRWNGEFDGFLFFSRSDHDGKHTCIEKINIKTGERTEIYRALLPNKLQWVEPEPESMKDEGFCYDLIPQLVSSNEIEKVEIYQSGTDCFDCVFIKKDGSRIPVEKPLYFSEDAVFLATLKSHNIEYIIDEEKEAKENLEKRVDILQYQSVPELLASKEIKKVEIYDRSGHHNIDAVFITTSATRIPVSRCYGLDDDPVFHQYLRDNNIRYTVYDKELKITSTNEVAPPGIPTTETIRSLIMEAGFIFLLILAASSPFLGAILLRLLFKKTNGQLLSALITLLFAIILFFVWKSSGMTWVWEEENMKASILCLTTMLVMSAGISFLFVKSGVVIGDRILKAKNSKEA
jgi:outer membrane protein assembly factor BamB